MEEILLKCLVFIFKCQVLKKLCVPGWAGMQPFMGEFSYTNICRVFPLGLSISLEKNLPDSWLGYEVSSQLCETLIGKGAEGACAQILDSLNPRSVQCLRLLPAVLEILEFSPSSFSP